MPDQLVAWPFCKLLEECQIQHGVRNAVVCLGLAALVALGLWLWNMIEEEVKRK